MPVPCDPDNLSLDDFEGDDFDAVKWLNRNIQNVQVLSTSLQFLCQDEAERVESMVDGIVAKMPSTLYQLDKLKIEVDGGKQRVQMAIRELSRAGRENFGFLTDMAITKDRLEIAKTALRELQGWDKRIQEVDTLLSNGDLLTLITHLESLREVCQSFRELAEYDQRAGSVRHFESELHTAAKRKFLLALETQNVSDLKVGAEIFVKCEMRTEMNRLVDTHFTNLVTKHLASLELNTMNASAVGEAIRQLFESLHNASRDIIEANTEILAESSIRKYQEASANVDPDSYQDGGFNSGLQSDISALSNQNSSNKSIQHWLIDLPRALIGALNALHSMLWQSMQENCQHSEAAGEFITKKASRLLGIWLSYVEGMERLAGCIVRGEGSEVLFTIFEAVPSWLIIDVLKSVFLPGLRETNNMSSGEKKRSNMASEALLTAETDAVKYMQALVKFARKDDVFVFGVLDFIGISAVDWHSSEFLTDNLGPLADIFQNTITEKTAASNSIDGTVLNLCLSYHNVLTHLQTQIENELERPILDLVKTSTDDSAMNNVDHDGDEPVSGSGRNSTGNYPRFAKGMSVKFLRQGIQEVQNEFRNFEIKMTYSQKQMHQSRNAIKGLIVKGEHLVISACVAPIRNILVNYGNTKDVWERVSVEDSGEPILSPQITITSVTEQLFSLVPLLEQAGLVTKWLPAALTEVANLCVAQVLQIGSLSPHFGFSQLMLDVEHVCNITGALRAENDEPTVLHHLVSSLKQIDAEFGLTKTASYDAASLMKSIDKSMENQATTGTLSTNKLEAKYDRGLRQKLRNFLNTQVRPVEPSMLESDALAAMAITHGV